MTSQPDTPPGASCAGGVAAELARMRGEVRGLTDTLWAARTPAELMDAVAEVEALKSTLDALELGMVRELDATHGVKPVGWASTQDFVTSVAGGHKGTGHAVVRLASAVTEPILAPVGDALRDGWLSTAKALIIERAIDTLPGSSEVRARGVQALLDEAKSLDATELRRVTRRLIAIVDPDGDERRAERELDREERSAHLGRELSVRFDTAGGCWIKGRCSAEDGAKLRATLLPLAKPVPAAGPVCDPASCEIPQPAGLGHDQL